MPKYPTKDPNYRILARQRSRFTHYYFYIRDETLGPMVMRVASFLPFQTTYYLNGHSFIEQELSALEHEDGLLEAVRWRDVRTGEETRRARPQRYLPDQAVGFVRAFSGTDRVAVITAEITRKPTRVKMP